MEGARFDGEQVHFLVFELDGQFYGIDVNQVEAIVEGQPGGERWSYEGQEVPLQYLARWIGLDRPAKPPSRVLISSGDVGLRAFLVDSPITIASLPVDDIFPIPTLIRQVVKSTPLWGVGRSARGLLLLVDLTSSPYEENTAGAEICS
jgi:chemotaxis signal transduction protein